MCNAGSSAFSLIRKIRDWSKASLFQKEKAVMEFSYVGNLHESSILLS